MTEASVTYIKPNRTDAGAIPVNTQIATHARTSDGASVQDVYIDPDSLPDDGVISAGNTTEVNLAGGATFEGTFENCLQYGAIRVAIYSSHASASRGLEFWCSKDGNNGFIDDSYTVPAATPKTYAVPVSALGVGDILSLCVIRDTTTNASVGAVINWNEIR